jgi:hypothetical protein
MTDFPALLASELDRVGAERFTARDYNPGTVVHVVLFRLRPEVDDDARAELVRRFRALESEPDDERGRYIVSLEAGAQNGGEGHDAGFELGFVLRFASEGDRNYYVGEPVQTDPRFFDPAHARFKEFAGPLIENVLVFDFAA